MISAALAVNLPVHVGKARSMATTAAREAGLPAKAVDRVSIAASELASNLVKYACEGLLAVVASPRGFDLLATDRGPGLRRPEEALRDGYSTSGSLGTGLGGVRRLADEFDLYSRYGEGTTVLARWVPETLPETLPVLGLHIGAAVFTAPGETVSGDAWTVVRSEGLVTFVVADGLGHGPDAAAASAAAVSHVAAMPAAPPAALLEAMDADRAAARGSAVAIAQFDLARNRLWFSGVGNIAARLYSATGSHETLVSVPGIVGRRQRRGRRADPLMRSWSEESRLIMHTDGVSERWNAADLHDAFGHDAATVAGWLLGQHCRRRDDACVLVVGGGDTR
ncbi:ATP-binding protein [Prauserella oleivorans]|uniref:ATP-binding protein n=1 Tax=Prauserella oleivorans TaxID=1478153 RepID=A0ABW5W4R4_9PSEU